MTPSTHEQLMKAVDEYQMPEVAKQLLETRAPVILCGITSAGKDTLANELVEGGGYEKVISHTTRAPRLNHGVPEEDGSHYFFIDEASMLNMVQEQAFIETKEVHGWVYGTGIDAYKAPLDRGHQPILVIDVQGAEELMTAVPDLRPIFLIPPSIGVWEDRLQGRGKLDDDVMRSRMQTAITEIETILRNINFQLVVNNDKVETAVFLRESIIGRDHDAVEVADRFIYDVKNWLVANK